MSVRRLAGGMLRASVLLFWMQALRTSFSTLFGIIHDQIFVGPVTPWLATSNGLLFLAVLGPLAFGSRVPARLRWLAPAAAAIGRMLLLLPAPGIRFWSSLVLIAAGGFYLADLLRRDLGGALHGLGAGLALDQLLRALGHTHDLSFQLGWLPLPLAWSGLALVAAFQLRTGEGAEREAGRRVGRVADGPEMGQPARAASPRRGRPQAGGEGAAQAGLGGAPAGWLAGLGLGGWLFLETSLLSVPNAAARWSGWHYNVLVPGLLLATWAPLGWAQAQDASRLARFRSWAALLLPAGLLLGYFASGPAAAAALLLAQAAAMLALSSLLRPAAAVRGAVGGLLLLLANYLNAFAFTYPYTLPFMRGLGWLVYLLSAAPVTICLLAGSGSRQAGRGARWSRFSWAIAGAAALLAAWAARPMRADPLPHGGLALASYNIHYGYDTHWQFSLEQQALTLQRNDVDVAALQEVDTGRITSYLVDEAYYLARRLRMNVAYLPTVEHLTGIAVLHRGEAIGVRRQLLSSQQEQTGIVGVELPLGSRSLFAFGVWLGLEDEDTLTQIREALEFIAATTPAVFAGDFNAVEGDPLIEQVRQGGFVDPFELLGLPPAPTHPAEHPVERLDYVWLRGMAPRRAWVAESLASDHRLAAVEAEPLP